MYSKFYERCFLSATNAIHKTYHQHFSTFCTTVTVQWGTSVLSRTSQHWGCWILGVWSSFQSSNHCSPLVLSCCTTISESMVVRTISLAIYIKSKNLNGLASPCNSEMIGDHSTKWESSEDRKEHWSVIPHQKCLLKTLVYIQSGTPK